MHENPVVKGCCPLDCQDTCSWVAHVSNGTVVKVSGATDHPITRGVLCAKVNDYQNRTYAPDRVLYPMQRSGRKGEGMFTRITWEQALHILAEKFQECIDSYGPESILPLNYIGSLGVLQRKSLMRIFHYLGTSRFHGSICGASANVLEKEGHPRRVDPEETVDSQFILIWGANLLSTSHHHFHFFKEAKKKHGTKLICIDPRKTITAKACDEHIFIRPGTDHILAMSMASVLIEENLVDLDFIDQHISDFGSYRDQVQKWPPEYAAKICGVSEETIVELARQFGKAKPATIRFGISPQQTQHGETTIRQISALTLITGQWRYPGGGLMIEANPIFHEQHASGVALLPRNSRSLDIARIGSYLTDKTLNPQIKALMIWGMNPAVDQPDAHLIHEGLLREDLFTVVVEHFITDTAMFADLVLPSTTQLEHFDAQGAWGHYYISINEPAIEPIGESKPHSEIMRLLARRMGLDHPAFRENDQDIVTSCLPKGLTLEMLKEKGWYKSKPTEGPLDNLTQKLNISEVTPVESLQNEHGYPLQLLTPKSHYFMNSSFANMPDKQKKMKHPIVEMHKKDAEVRNLKDGQAVQIFNEKGTLDVSLQISENIYPGVLSLPGKWWGHPEHMQALSNILTPSSWSPGGQPAFNETWVDVK